MESIFSYISFEIDKELENIKYESIPSTLAHDSVSEPIANTIKMVRTASRMALDSLGLNRKKSNEKIKKKPGVISIAARGVYKTTAFLAHQVGAVTSSVTGVVSRPLDSTLDHLSHFGVSWLRNTLNFEHHSLRAVRLGEKITNSLLQPHNGVTKHETSFVVNLTAIADLEERGGVYLRASPAWRYPLPRDSETKWKIMGEWLIPDQDHSKKTKREQIFGTFFNPQKPRKIILFLHGGAYVIGSIGVYRTMTSLLAKNNECPVFAINYRLAPEYPFPCALHDAFATYLWLMDPLNPMFENTSQDALHEPFLPEEIVISGDSAGGGLTLALLNYINMYLRNPNGQLMVPLPRGAVLLSPWVDLTCSSQSWEDNQGLDFLPKKATNLHEPITASFQHPVYAYCFGESEKGPTQLLSPISSTNRIPSLAALNLYAASPMPLTPTQVEDRNWCLTLGEKKRDALERMVRHPLISPIFGDFAGLPPILIQSGDAELLRDEGIALAYRYSTHNHDSQTSWVRHELYKDMVHDFQIATAFLPHAVLAMKQFTLFIHELFHERMSTDDFDFTDDERKLIKMIDSHLF